jgi:ABC-2 type transport system permease protein
MSTWRGRASTRATQGEGGGPVRRQPLNPGRDLLVAAGGGARIYEAGYRPYEGIRLGVSHSVLALARHSAERIIGLKRPARYKVLPFASVVIAYLPAVAFIGIVAVVPKGADRLLRLVPGPGRYYGFVIAAIVLFAVFAAPEALCPDRRSRFLGMYLASPLNRSTYLLSKAIAVVSMLLLVTVGPPLLLLVGLSLQGDGPAGFLGFLSALGRILAAGLTLSIMFGALGLAIPSLTDRRAFASAGSLLLIVGSGALSGVVVYALHGARDLLALGLDRLPFELALRIFGLRGLPTTAGSGSQGGLILGRPPPATLSTWVVVVASIAITVLAAAITWWRVMRMEVTR